MALSAVAAGCKENAENAASGAAAAAAPGSLNQLAAPDGCVATGGDGTTCTAGNALQGASAIALAGNNAYVVSPINDSIAVFARDATTGTLTQLSGTAGCIRQGGEGGCARGKALDGATAVATWGGHVYVASSVSDAVAVFARNLSTGALTQLAGTDGCISETGAGGCTDGKALDGAASIAANGRNVYVASTGSDAIAIFERKSSGKLVQKSGTAGCIGETAAGGCTDGKALDGAASVSLSGNERSVYVASAVSDAVAVFARNATSTNISFYGRLAQLAGNDGCVSETGAGPCADGKALDGARLVKATADGTSVYVAGVGGSSVGVLSVFQRNPTTGKLTQLAGVQGCLKGSEFTFFNPAGCAQYGGTSADSGPDFHVPWGVALSPDGGDVYVGASSLWVFDRASSGALSLPPDGYSCVNAGGSANCSGRFSVVVAPDGKFVYALTNGNVPTPHGEIWVYARNP